MAMFFSGQTPQSIPLAFFDVESEYPQELLSVLSLSKTDWHDP